MKDLLEKMDKKFYIIIGCFMVLIFVIIFGGALLYNKLFYKISYDEVRNVMKEAAVEYLNDRPEKLPQNISDSITLTEDTLVNAGRMKNINELVKEDAVCDGEVIVTNVNGNYRYNPILNCDDKYESIKFADYINDNVEVVTTGNGLYKSGDTLLYRGDNVNNYLNFFGNTYRIVKIENDHAVLILTERTESIVWDDRYNIDKDSDVGINNYNVSRIKDYLQKLYEGTLLIDDKTLFNDNSKLLMTNHTIKIGKRDPKDSDNSGNIENAINLEGQYVSLLPVYDFLNASIDVNCTTTTAESCSNYNYLAKYNFNWWLATANPKNTHQVYKVGKYVNLATASSSSYVRPVIYLVNDAIYVSGDGSKTNPYTVR